MAIVELLVRMDCRGCERNIRKMLMKIKGVDSVEVDYELKKVTVTGYNVDQMKILKRLRKAGKAAELWNPTFMDDRDYQVGYVHTPAAFSRTYNYEKHGFNSQSIIHNEYTSQSFEHFNEDDSNYEGVKPSMFSDENPNNCSIM